MYGFSNPNDNWIRPDYDPYKDLSNEQRTSLVLLRIIIVLGFFAAALFVCALISKP